MKRITITIDVPDNVSPDAFGDYVTDYICDAANNAGFCQFDVDMQFSETPAEAVADIESRRDEDEDDDHLLGTA